MPIYEYRCQACGHQLEEIQKVSDSALTNCPACGKAKLQRLISHTSFHLKGSGWYATDFKDKPKTGAAPSTPTETSKPSESTEQAAKTNATEKKPADNKTEGS